VAEKEQGLFSPKSPSGLYSPKSPTPDSPPFRVGSDHEDEDEDEDEDENIKEEMVEPPRASGALPPEFDGGDVWG